MPYGDNEPIARPGNSGRADIARPALEPLLSDRSELVRDAAQWALARLAREISGAP